MKIKSPTRATRRNPAFTLAEVVIASGLIAISCVSLLIALSMGFSMVQANRENLRATQVMVQKTETLRLYNWSELQATNFFNPAFSEYFNPVSTNGVLYVGQISLSVPTNLPANYTSDVFAVTVSVRWTNYMRGQPIVHNRQMETYAALHGIQNYKY